MSQELKQKSKQKIKPSMLVLISLFVINTVFMTSIAQKQHAYVNEKMDHLMKQLEYNFHNLLTNLYFTMGITEQMTVHNYGTISNESLDAILKPIIETYDYRNIGILPNGVVEYIYPLKNNEKAIGDNVFEMPHRVVEAQLALETGEIIVSGPYKLTQGGEAFILRKAIFDEEGFWGFVAVTIDKEVLLEKINFEAFILSNYQYRFTATVNGLETKVIDESKTFDEKKARWIEIDLANGIWQLGVVGNNYAVNYFFIFFFLILGYVIAFAIARLVWMIECKLDFVYEESCVDRLTRVNNRRALDYLEEELSANKLKYTVLYIDLNDFKPINDTYGHDVGDEVLVAFCERLRTVARKTDFIIRMGGDEFIIILLRISTQVDIDAFCQRLREIQLKTIDEGERKILVKFSYGYSIAYGEDERLSDVIRKADRQMYKEKQDTKMNTSDKN